MRSESTSALGHPRLTNPTLPPWLADLGLVAMDIAGADRGEAEGRGL